MRIKSAIQELTPGNPGKAVLLCDSVEDLWHLYNLVVRGDFIKTITFRKVAHESSAGMKISSTKKKFNLTIKIEEIEYDQKEGIIRYKGKNVSENEYVALGQYQSIEIAKGIQFTVFKKNWDEMHIERLIQATDPTISSDLAAIVMEEGVCHIFLISSHITTLKAKIEQTIPKKRKGASQHDKSLVTFFQKVLDAIVKSINFELVKCVIVASPGFTKDQFSDYLSDNTSNNKHYEIIQKNLNKFIYTHSSNGYKQALQEILAKPEVMMQIKNTKASEDINVMERFNEILAKDMDRIIFGLKHVEDAFKKGAIDTLIVSDDYLRKISPKLRQEVSKIMKGVKETGEVIKMSSMHYTGEKINAFGGITAILKYALPELNEVEEEVVAVDEMELDHHQEEIEEDDKFAMLTLDDALNLEKEKSKGTTENIEEESKGMDEEEDDLRGGEDEEEEGEEEEASPKIKPIKGGRVKPTKEEKKERDQVRKHQMRKRSNLEEEN
jgi:protein pelota